MQLHAFHPDSPARLAARDALLQRALRPDGLPFGIAAEYPLVLAPAEAERSLCFAESRDGELLAHANLLPRTTTNGRRIGLVGNVATDERHRGRGIMRAVFAELGARAEALGLEALLLWSDLLEFYQKVGFRSFGAELRLIFTPAGLQRAGAREGGFRGEAPPRSEAEAARLLAVRYGHAPALARTPAELMRQLEVPATDLLVARGAGGEPTGYLVQGKGYDMGGVVHEWGAASPAALLGGLLDTAVACGLGEVMLLAPGGLAAPWRAALARAAARAEEHPMALMRPLAGAADDAGLAGLFVWGLDSI